MKRNLFALLVFAVLLPLGIWAAGQTEGPAELPMGMVDTSKYTAEGPWLAGRAGLGDTNAWMTMFGLHFRYQGDSTPNIRLSLGAPLIGEFTHWRRGGDRIDGDHLVSLMGNISSCFVAVNRDLFTGH